jgi:hypothetical protein
LRLPAVALALFGFVVVRSVDFDCDLHGGIGDVDGAVRCPELKEPARAEVGVEQSGAEGWAEIATTDIGSSLAMGM